MRPGAAGAAQGLLPHLGLTHVRLGAGPHLVRYIHAQDQLDIHLRTALRAQLSGGYPADRSLDTRPRTTSSFGFVYVPVFFSQYCPFAIVVICLFECL